MILAAERPAGAASDVRRVDDETESLWWL